MSTPKSTAVHDIDIDIADITGQKYRYRQSRYGPTSIIEALDSVLWAFIDCDFYGRNININKCI